MYHVVLVRRHLLYFEFSPCDGVMNLVISANLRHPYLTSAVCQPASDKKHENVNVASVQRMYTELYKCLSTQCGKVVSSTGKILQPVIHQEDVI